MSTRCQVKIRAVNGDDREAVTLYHHCDGYPSNMVPLIASAYQPGWEHGRVGKAASYVVAEDVGGYDIEQGHQLHGDIEWYYVLSIESELHIGAVPKWYLNVYDVPMDCNSVADMRLVFSGTILDAVKSVETMES